MPLPFSGNLVVSLRRIRGHNFRMGQGFEYPGSARGFEAICAKGPRSGPAGHLVFHDIALFARFARNPSARDAHHGHRLPTVGAFRTATRYLNTSFQSPWDGSALGQNLLPSKTKSRKSTGNFTSPNEVYIRVSGSRGIGRLRPEQLAAYCFGSNRDQEEQDDSGSDERRPRDHSPVAHEDDGPHH